MVLALGKSRADVPRRGACDFLAGHLDGPLHILQTGENGHQVLPLEASAIDSWGKTWVLGVSVR